MELPKSQNTPQVAKRATYTVRCSNCGYRNPPNHNFCGSCGNALSHPSPNVLSKPLEGKTDNSSTQPVRTVKKLVGSERKPRFLVWGSVAGVIFIAGMIGLITAAVSLTKNLGIGTYPNTPEGITRKL